MTVDVARGLVFLSLLALMVFLSGFLIGRGGYEGFTLSQPAMLFVTGLLFYLVRPLLPVAVTNRQGGWQLTVAAFAVLCIGIRMSKGFSGRHDWIDLIVLAALAGYVAYYLFVRYPAMTRD